MLMGLFMLQVCDTEEDLYVFDDEDYSEDVSLAPTQLGQYQAFQQYPPNFTNYRGVSGMLGTPSGVGPYPAPHSGSQTPLLPPQPAIGGFFRGVEPSAASLIYPPPTLGYYTGQGALPFSEGQQLPNFGSSGPGIPAQVCAIFVFISVFFNPLLATVTAQSVAEKTKGQLKSK